MQVRIYKTLKNPMQSAHNKNDWVIEFTGKEKDRFLEPLMSRTSSKNMIGEVELKFETCDDAIRFAEKNNYIYEVITQHAPKIIKKSYASNFK
jgi:hypothetical protein